MDTILGQKKTQTQRFLEDGTRIPVTLVYVAHNPVTAIKTDEKHGYSAVQLGFGTKKVKKTKVQDKEGKQSPRFLREVRIMDASLLDTLPKVGEAVEAATVLHPGDIIDVTGLSKGKGFAGGVKRYHFKGGPRTHGQSDRERAPGSIGQTTTPGRVYKGKRMAGKMGYERVTVKNLLVVDVEGESLMVKGLVPGVPGGLLVIRKVGQKKTFVPLLKMADSTAVEVEQPVVAEDTAAVEAVVTE